MRKCLSFILSVIMSISAIASCLNVSAANEDNDYVEENAALNSAEVTNSGLNVTGTNSLGNLLANEFEETEDTQNDGMYGISNLIMDGDTASVSYHSKGGATLLVAIYDESGSQLITSGTHDIVTADDTVENQTSEVIINGSLPEFYLGKH